MKNKITELLDNVDRKEALKIIAEILQDYGLTTAANLAGSDCEPYLSKFMFEDGFYSEGDESAGFIALKTILEAVEAVVNCDDYISDEISFEYFIRPETPEESEYAERGNGVEWWTKDDKIDMDKLYIQFRGD